MMPPSPESVSQNSLTLSNESSIPHVSPQDIMGTPPPIADTARTAIVHLDLASRMLEEARFLDTPKVSILIPAFNERKTIETVTQLVEGLDIQKQIIVIDDGSSDGTREIIAGWASRPGFHVILHPQNRGKGAAIQSGIQAAKGDVVIVQDADLEYFPEDILKVIQPILDGESDVVFGSRYLGNSHQDQSALHRFGNALLTGLSNWMTHQRLTDMETCYKAFRRELIQGIQIEQKRFGFEPEITAKLAKRHIVIREVPIRYQSRNWKEGKKIGFKDLISTLWCILKYRFVHG